jgi:CubicO group peptidase (beta-lactamase class C family)
MATNAFHAHAAALVLLGGITLGCAPARPAPEGSWHSNIAVFEEEIQDLQTALAIPGLAYVIVEDGDVLASGAFGVAQGAEPAPFTITTPLRIASVTKALTAVVAMQLVEAGTLDLDAPAHQYVRSRPLPDDVLVKHLLTHTSEGQVGTEYVYGTTRYALLGAVIESMTGAPFEDVIRQRILERAGMQTYPSPALGAHAGLVSTTHDMGAFLAALDRDALLQPASLARLASPSRTVEGTPLPVSLGWFAQTVQGRDVLWSFGQDDPEHSGALLVRLPDRKLSLFVLANANWLSDPFRLLMGDVSKSPFATSFLRLFAFSERGDPLRRPKRGDPAIARVLAELEAAGRYQYRDELIGWALVDLWTGDPAEAQRKFDLMRTRYPQGMPDAVAHFAAFQLPDASSQEIAIRDGERLLAAHPTNRWMLLAQGYLLQARARSSEASECFQAILALPNQEADVVHRLFKVWSWMALAQMSAEHDPAQAAAYLREIIASGVTGGMLDDATRMLDGLVPAKRPVARSPSNIRNGADAPTVR